MILLDIQKMRSPDACRGRVDSCDLRFATRSDRFDRCHDRLRGSRQRRSLQFRGHRGKRGTDFVPICERGCGRRWSRGRGMGRIDRCRRSGFVRSRLCQDGRTGQTWEIVICSATAELANHQFDFRRTSLKPRRQCLIANFDQFQLESATLILKRSRLIARRFAPLVAHQKK